MGNNSMNELLSIQNEAHNKEREALEEEVTRSQEQFKRRLTDAQNDPTLHIEVKDDNKDED